MSLGSRSRGFTLIEVSVYSLVLLLLLGGVFMVVEGGLRYFRQAEAQETVNQQASIALARVRQELANASQSGVYLQKAPREHILFLSPFGKKGSGQDQYEYGVDGSQVLWKKWVCFYVDSEDRLVRAESELSTPVLEPSDEKPLKFNKDILPLPAETVAHNVVGLDFQYFPPPAVIRVSVETRATTGSDRTTSITMLSSVRLTNI